MIKSSFGLGLQLVISSLFYVSVSGQTSSESSTSLAAQSTTVELSGYDFVPLMRSRCWLMFIKGPDYHFELELDDYHLKPNHQ
jgi:hypothetical protein